MTLTATEIDNCDSIENLRAHVVACGFSGVWFDSNIEGAIRYARVLAHTALSHRVRGF